MKHAPLFVSLSSITLALASCGTPAVGDSIAPPEAIAASDAPFTPVEMAVFDEPWAMAFIPGTPLALVTEKKGRLILWEEGGKVKEVPDMPKVAYGGQGGFGDVAVRQVAELNGETRTLVWLSWAEDGGGDTRGAAVGVGELVLGDQPRLKDFKVVWRQSPKVTGRGHYSHRLAFAPDGKALFIASGDRQKMQPAQDPNSDLGKVIRLPLDGQGYPAGAPERFSLGHRNILGLTFDRNGQLWDLEHGPAGGDELNLVSKGTNYGWPVVSQGNHYSGSPIARHATRPEFQLPAISWNPVIAPGGIIFYKGQKFPKWQGHAIIAAMATPGLVQVEVKDNRARELARYQFDRRIRAITERDDGTIWVLEDGDSGRMLRLDPR